MKFRLFAPLFALAITACASNSQKNVTPEESGQVTYDEDSFSASSGSGRSDEEVATMNRTAVPPEESGEISYGAENFSASSGSGLNDERMPSSKKKKNKHHKKTKKSKSHH